MRFACPVIYLHLGFYNQSIILLILYYLDYKGNYQLYLTLLVNGIEYDGIMSQQGLDDEEVADVMNYILNSWGNKAKEQISITHDLFL